MTEVIKELRYWLRALAAGLYVVVTDFSVLGHMPTPEEAWIPMMKGAGAVLVALGVTAGTRTKP